MYAGTGMIVSGETGTGRVEIEIRIGIGTETEGEIGTEIGIEIDWAEGPKAAMSCEARTTLEAQRAARQADRRVSEGRRAEGPKAAMFCVVRTTLEAQKVAARLMRHAGKRRTAEPVEGTESLSKAIKIFRGDRINA